MSDLFDVAKDGTELVFVDHGINWNWYLKVKTVWPHGELKVEILKHWRVHKGDEGHPAYVGFYRILENSSRTACAVRLDFHNVPMDQAVAHAAVENPKNVFQYN